MLRLILLLVCNAIIFSACSSSKDSSVKSKMIFNVKEYGAKGDGLTDDSNSIQKLIDELPSNATLYFPIGKYKVSRNSFSNPWCLRAKSNIRLEGEDKTNSVLLMAPDQGNYTRQLYIEDVENVQIKNICFDGNVENQRNPDKPYEHLKGIFLNRAKDVVIDSCIFKNSGGDGLGMRGIKTPCENITISNSEFNYNKRSGITLGSGFLNIKILNNIFRDNRGSGVDAEPASKAICRKVLIEGNDFQTDGMGFGTKGVKRMLTGEITIRNNTFTNSTVAIVRVEDVLIENNTFENSNGRKPIFNMLTYNNNIRIINNTISANSNHIFKIQPRKTLIPENIVIDSNTIVSYSDKATMSIMGVKNLRISNNTIESTNSKFILSIKDHPENENIQIVNNVFSSANGILYLDKKSGNSISPYLIKDNVERTEDKQEIPLEKMNIGKRKFDINN